MLTPLSRGLVYGLAAAYTLLGAILFVLPGWSSENFAWKISPFVAMTMGGWCLGNGWAAFVVARRRHWPAVFSASVYLAAFGLFETATMIAFRARLNLAPPLAWLYVATILATAVTALFFAVEYSRQRAVIAPLGEPTRWIDNLLVIVFILFVAFLGFYGLTAVEGSRGLNATIFPEPMSMFTLRAFGSFYLAISIAAIPLLFARGRKNVLSHGYALYGLLVFITIATAVFIGHFDFAGRPTQLIYPGVYVTVAIVVGFYLLRYGTGSAEQQSTASPAAQK